MGWHRLLHGILTKLTCLGIYLACSKSYASDCLMVTSGSQWHEKEVMSRFIWWKTGQLSHWVNDVTLPQWSFDLSSKLKMRTWHESLPSPGRSFPWGKYHESSSIYHSQYFSLLTEHILFHLEVGGGKFLLQYVWFLVSTSSRCVAETSMVGSDEALRVESCVWLDLLPAWGTPWGWAERDLSVMLPSHFDGRRKEGATTLRGSVSGGRNRSRGPSGESAGVDSV